MSEPSDVRKEIQASLKSVTATSCIGLLSRQYEALLEMNRSIEVDDASGLSDKLAEDIFRLGGAASLDAAKPLAKGQIEANKTTAITTSDDYYVSLKGGEKFDELHELIHICSAQGGLSTLHNFKLQLNEGAINLFSEEVSKQLANVKFVSRYAAETKIARQLVKLIDDVHGKGTGLTKLFSLTFKAGGNVDEFFTVVGESAKSKIQEKGSKPNAKLTFAEKKLLDTQASVIGTDLQKKMGNWSTSWLKSYC